MGQAYIVHLRRARARETGWSFDVEHGTTYSNMRGLKEQTRNPCYTNLRYCNFLLVVRFPVAQTRCAALPVRRIPSLRSIHPDYVGEKVRNSLYALQILHQTAPEVMGGE